MSFLDSRNQAEQKVMSFTYRKGLIIAGLFILLTGVMFAFWLLFSGRKDEAKGGGQKKVSLTAELKLPKRQTLQIKRMNKTEEAERSLRYLNNALRNQDDSRRNITLDAVNSLKLFLIDGTDISVKDMLNDESLEVRVRAGAILARQGDESVKDMLSACLKRGTPQIRFEAASGLVSLGDKSGVDVLIAGLNDPNWNIRREAAIAVGETMQPELTGILKPLLNDPSEYVRIAAAGSMLKLGDASAKNILYNALKSPDSAIQYSAAIPLAEAGDPAPLEFFRSEFRNYDLSVKGHVAYYMALLGDKSGLPALREAAELGDEETRTFASAALIAISSEPL